MKNTPKKKICVLGLGYIGLPTASMFATQGYQVHGVDVNPTVLSTLKEGRIHIEEPGLATIVKAAIASENLSLDSHPVPSDVFIITVPTPYRHSSAGLPMADMSYVKSAIKAILPHLKKNNLVILESTSPPGTTRDLVIPMLKEAHFEPGKDLGVAYCPERVIPGQALKELVGNDRVVGAINEMWGEETKRLYKSFVSGEIFVTEPTVAEMVKILENTYRDVNIALANEIALLCEKLNINVWEVINITNRHPRVNVHKPGPGVGGHCISVDPWFLVEKFPKDTNLVPLARQMNDRMPHQVVKTIESILGKGTKAKISVLGLAYKGNVDDTRESPALTVIDLLQKNHPSYELAVYDPHAATQDFPKKGIQDIFDNADLAVILTPHDEFRFMDPEEVGALMRHRIVYDTHNILKSERWVPAGFQVHVLGSGRSHKNKTATLH